MLGLPFQNHILPNCFSQQEQLKEFEHETLRMVDEQRHQVVEAIDSVHKRCVDGIKEQADHMFRELDLRIKKA